MNKQFKGKNIIITGGSGGIGSVLVEEFLLQGAQVLVVDTKISQQTKSLTIDVSDREQVEKLGSYIKNTFEGRVDVLINAAGIYGPIGRFEELDLGHWEKTIAVNLFGTVNVCSVVIPFMKKEGHGKIINFSGGGDGPNPRFTAYGASKAAVVRLTESLAEELSLYDIYVNAVAPGPVNTAFLDEVLKAGPDRAGKGFYLKSKKQKDDGGTSPKMVRDLILFLASEDSGILSGKLISAVHDDWKHIPRNLEVLNTTDVYNVRRIKHTDRGYK